MDKNEFNKEQEILQTTYVKLQEKIREMEKEIAMPADLDFSNCNNNDELFFLNQQRERHEILTKPTCEKIEKYKKMLKEIYFARIDLSNDEYIETYYISKKGKDLPDLSDDIDIRDWRTDIGGLLSNGNTKTEYEGKNIDLKRRFVIEYDKLKRYDDVLTNKYLSDEFLIEVLNEKKMKKGFMILSYLFKKNKIK